MSERPTHAPLSIAAFATLLFIALLMGANHVAARIAFDHGVDVATAVAVRSAVTALAVGAVGVQSACLYSAVARLPVALALLAFNTYPLLVVATVVCAIAVSAAPVCSSSR